MKNRFKHFRKSYLFMALLVTFSTSCTLLNVTMPSMVDPLSQKEVNIRMQVRSFAEVANNAIIEASDSIINSTENPEIRINAIKWKLNSTAAYTNAAFQTIPEASLSDVWILTLQWQEFFNKSGENYFTEFVPIAQSCADELSEQITSLGNSLTKAMKRPELRDFVYAYTKENALVEMTSSTPRTLTELNELIGAKDTTFASTVGSSGQVMSDLTERLARYQLQLQNSVEWQKDRFTITWEENNLDGKLFERTDTLASILSNIAIIVQEIPEMMGIIAEKLGEELSPIVYDFNSMVNRAVSDLIKQREAFEV
ncbi:hypothetical protein OU798_19605 [Prolixibacteraceae bacterium Z1-6]|uniref:Imelysin-like domain-containing protein n=1 Tax=Draconibacterium aestuarii TaxID=2998507 RepID=A0A9X3J9A5_9BACT|nr:hypothetical protein [Prolixibacteraceae bacterium Z1-6]